MKGGTLLSYKNVTNEKSPFDKLQMGILILLKVADYFQHSLSIELVTENYPGSCGPERVEYVKINIRSTEGLFID